MSTRYVQSFETGTLGSAVGTAMPPGEKTFSAATAAAIDNTHVMHGTKAVKNSPASGAQGSERWAGLAIPVASSFAVSGYLWYDTLVSDETYIWRLNGTDNALICMLELSNTGKFRVIDKSGTTTPLFTSTPNYPVGQYVRFELFGSALGAAGTIKAALFAGDSLTPLTGLSMPATAANTGSGVAGDVAIFGKGNSGTSALPHWMDSFQMEIGGTDYIGPWVSQLASPILTLENSINPSAVGGSDGQATVSWSPVAGAGSYNAYKSTKASPTDADLAAGLVQAGVTSPFTFTGLKAGATTVAIQAEP